MEKMEHIILEELQGDRIDKAVLTFAQEWSRTQVQQLIKAGHVLVNGQKVKTNYKCALNDKIEISIPEPEELDIIPEKMDLDIYYEDQDVLVVNKESGLSFTQPRVI